MKRCCILLADGFEQTEALTTHDIFCRSHEIEPVLVSTMRRLEVTSSMGLRVQAHALLESLREEDFDFLVLPGGKKGVENLKANPKVIDLVKAFHEAGKPHFAICAAPSILGELGYLDGKSYTCFPGFQTEKGEYQNVGAVQDGDLITGHSMGHTIAFAEAILAYFFGPSKVEAVRVGTLGGANK